LNLRHLCGTRKWLGAACAVSLACACSLAVEAYAQTSDAAKTASDNQASSKTHPQAAAKASGANSATIKHTAHPASHPPAASHSKSTVASASHPPTTKHASSRKNKKTARGQQKIDSDRAQEIQEALIREHYLSGEASGKWNQASEDAMRRYQADHGWQIKTVPDSRALIGLGLGPSKDHLLNPESAMTTGPDAPRAASLTPVSHRSESAAPASKTPAADPAPAATSQPDSPRPQ
jgi:hypothetical protein